MSLLRGKVVEVDCTVQVSHLLDDLSAHVEIDGGLCIGPGDRVRVHGPPIAPVCGRRVVQRRRATVTRASALGRLWCRLTGNLGCLSLIEVGSEERMSS